MDAHANFAYSTVATAPSPPTSDTSLVLHAGDGALLPAAPFNMTVWPAGAVPLKTNAEIVRVTARVVDTLTIARAQEGTTARSIQVGDQIALTITAKTLADIEAVFPPAQWTMDTSSDDGCFVITSTFSDLVITIGYLQDEISIIHSSTGSGIVIDGNGQITTAGSAGGGAVIAMGGSALTGPTPPPASVDAAGLPASNFALLRTILNNLGSLDVPVVAANAGMVIPSDFEIPSGYDFIIDTGGVLDVI